MTDQTEFIVSGVVTGVSGRLHVIGRCGDYPIRVGETFGQVEEPDSTRFETKLTIESMQAYGERFDEISEGMTATIDVSGHGTDRIRPGCVLISGSRAGHSTDSNIASKRS